MSQAVGTELVALAAFSFVSSVTPGPNNVLLWASGAAFGLRRTVPHIVGTAVGIGAMALGAAAGIAALVAALPGLAVAMRVAGSAYLLFLAWQIARSGALGSAAIGQPLGVRSAAAFQVINPKAWVFALGAVTTFRPLELPVAVGSLVVAVTMMAVIVPTAALWAAGGRALSRVVEQRERRRVVTAVLAFIVAVTVVLVWL